MAVTPSISEKRMLITCVLTSLHLKMTLFVFILMNSRGKYEVKGLLVLANMSTKSKAAVSCRNDAQRCTYRHIRL